jgi:hypothetical protein
MVSMMDVKRLTLLELTNEREKGLTTFLEKVFTIYCHH